MPLVTPLVKNLSDLIYLFYSDLSDTSAKYK